MGDKIARFRSPNLSQDLTGAPPVITTPPTLAAQIGPGQVDSTRMAASTNGGSTVTQGTTTDTTQWVTVKSYSIVLPPRVVLLTPVSLHVKHTAANALVGLAVALYTNDGSGAATTAWLADVEMSATVSTWHTVSGTGINYPDVNGIAPGTRYLYLIARNYTTGTLTIGDSVYDFLSHLMFGY